MNKEVTKEKSCGQLILESISARPDSKNGYIVLLQFTGFKFVNIPLKKGITIEDTIDLFTDITDCMKYEMIENNRGSCE